MKTLAFILITFLNCNFILAQSLEGLKQEYSAYNEQRIERVLEYASKRNIPIIQQLTSGVTICLQDVIDGNPHYIKTDNLGAAATTGADDLGIDGSLGLNLDGSGVSIAIWDGGLVRTTHNELTGRITPSDGSSSLNFHATHVAGTILSEGQINTAKGMAINATARTFDFNNDDSEMLQFAGSEQEGTILSNHSYGSISGWNDGVWFGDESISEIEDWKFGFYTSGAASWDNIAYNSPYYTIVKSAGNDRGDSGSGHPADGPYDIISTTGTAKNIITIGAVNKVTNYAAPSDVVMSSFSGWGPTDDGRIKPDFVAAGVNVFSTFETADDAYGNLSGTSMSTPNATGTFALLQQLYKKLSGGNFMKSALLKGLIAHTALEAGNQDGPDYRFGWGLVNGVGAADLLLRSNGLNVRTEEIRLEDQDSYSITINPEIGETVKATICWTDPAGTPPALSLDPENLILVNDLDMRISNLDETNEPWILNPASPGSSAERGDNFRDNIEVIEFVATSEEYDLNITHKNSLTNGFQDVFLILTYQDANSLQTTQYWTGDDGSFDLASNWSETSGGTGDGQTPNSNTSLIFDNNSFSGEGEITLGISANTNVGDFIYLAEQPLTFDIGANDLTISGKFAANSNITFQGSGSIIFNGSTYSNLASTTTLAQMDVKFDNEQGHWFIGDGFTANSFEVSSGTIDLSNSAVALNSLTANSINPKEIILDNSNLTITGNMSVSANNTLFSDSDAQYTLTGSTVTLNLEGVSSQGSIHVVGSAEISDMISINSLDLEGDLKVSSTLHIEEFSGTYGSSLEIENNESITFDQLSFSGESEDPFEIFSLGAADVFLEGHRKICLEQLEISNVDQAGEATISVGENSTITNSTGWIEASCDNVLFSDFTSTFNCIGSYVFFQNNSQGAFTSQLWDFDGLGDSTDEEPYFTFMEAGEYDITLTVSNGENSSSFTKTIVIGENIYPDVEVSVLESVLLSSEVAPEYQWFKNGVEIEGANERFYQYGSQVGIFQVVLFYEDCNVPSTEVELFITGNKQSESLKIYPNPSEGMVEIASSNGESYSIKVYDINGKLTEDLGWRNTKKVKVDLTHLNPGLYIIELQSDSFTRISRILLK